MRANCCFHQPPQIRSTGFWTLIFPSSTAVRTFASWRCGRRHISERTREDQSDPETGPGGILQDLLVKKFGMKPGKRLQKRIRVAAEVGDRLIAYAYAQPTAKERTEILDELKELLAGYLLRI